MMFAKLGAMQKTLPNPEYQLVTFTVDPANDTPAVLKQESQGTGSRRSRWSFLTGDKDSVYKLHAKACSSPSPSPKTAR